MSITLALLMQAAPPPDAEPLIVTRLFGDGSQQIIECAKTEKQQELNECAAADFSRADDALNQQWDVTSARMKAIDAADVAFDDGRVGHFEALLASQRAWLAYRDAHCVNEGYWARGGSMEPMLVSFCLAELTRERTEQLRQLAEYPE